MDYSPVPDFKEPLSTPPKLSLFSLPSKPSTIPDGPTPPPNMVANVPFLWEEAPGKPRKTYITTTSSTIDNDPTKSKVVRSLELPPRLTATTASPANNYSGNKCGGEKLVNNVRIQIVPSPTTSTVLSNPYEVNNVRIQIVPSPTTVLNGPYEGHVYPSNTLGTLSSNNNKSTKGKMRMPLRKLMGKEKSAIVKFGSWRWQSFRDTDNGGKMDRSPSSGRFCSWRWDSFTDTFSGGGGSSGSLGSSFRDLHKSIDLNGKITRKK